MSNSLISFCLRQRNFLLPCIIIAPSSASLQKFHKQIAAYSIAVIITATSLTSLLCCQREIENRKRKQDDLLQSLMLLFHSIDESAAAEHLFCDVVFAYVITAKLAKCTIMPRCMLTLQLQAGFRRKLAIMTYLW